MNIVGIQDIGPMGPSEGEPIVFHWPIYMHAVRLILLLTLVVLLLRAPNRTPGAWLVLLPVLALPLLASWILTLDSIPQMLSFLYDSIAIFAFALAFLWTLADKLGNRPRMETFGYALLLLALASIIGLIGVSSLGFGLHSIPTAIVYAILAGGSFVVMSLAGLACNKRYTPLRYLVCLYFILVIGGVILVLLPGLLILPGMLLAGSDINIYSFLAGFLVAGFVGGSALFLLLAPYLALALWSPVYRKRFHAVFRLSGMDWMDSAAGMAYNDDSNSGGSEQ